MSAGADLQSVIERHAAGAVVAVDSAYHVDARNRGSDVMIAASYTGVLPARFVAEHAPRGLIGMDCAIGPDGAGIAGLWYLEALGIPAATVDVMTVLLGDGVDMAANGIISRVNHPATTCGVEVGMPALAAARRLLEVEPQCADAAGITNRTVVATADDGRAVVCTDSIAFGLPEDAGRNVLCTAGHTGRSAVPYLREMRPHGFICSDGGWGRDGSGVAGLWEVEAEGLAGAAVDARAARMGDGRSTYEDGVISAANAPARARGVEVGMPARDAAWALLTG